MVVYMGRKSILLGLIITSLSPFHQDPSRRAEICRTPVWAQPHTAGGPGGHRHRRRLPARRCPPHTRTPPAGPDPRRSSPRWRPVPEGEAALQQLARRRRWHGASDSDLVSHRCPSNPHPLGRPQASPSPPKRSVPAAWHQGSREDGCSSGRRAGSARRLQPLKPSASTHLDLSSLLLA